MDAGAGGDTAAKRGATRFELTGIRRVVYLAVLQVSAVKNAKCFLFYLSKTPSSHLRFSAFVVILTMPILRRSSKKAIDSHA